MKTIKVSFVALWIAVATAVGIIIGVVLAPVSKYDNVMVYSNSGDGYSASSKISDLLYLISTKYVDTVSFDSLVDEALATMLEDLDPHSVYIPASTLTSEMESLEGNFEGIGVMFRLDEDTILVIQTINGGPAEKAGVMAGDRIITINDSVVAGKGITNDDVIHQLKGKKGTKVRIGVKRSGVPKLLSYTLKRDVITTNSVTYKGMVAPGVGYIKLEEFSSDSYSEFVNALFHLQEKGAKKLILDLRGNSGGYLDQAVAIVDEFLSNGKDLIVYTEDRNRRQNKSFATANGEFTSGALVVMIDEFSASASEIVAGAIQDNDRGAIVGRRSFGKGLVQEQFQLKDGSALRLTVARYYTPSGRCIQRPYEKGTDEYYQDFLMRLTAEMSDSMNYKPKDDTLKYYTKSGRVVYGGGGILPDVVIPYEKDVTYVYYNTLLRKGLVQKYAFEYVDRHGNELKKQYTSADSFVQNFNVDNSGLETFVQYTEKHGVPRDKASIAAHGKELKTSLKAYIAEILYGQDAFYEIYLTNDPELAKALKVVQSIK
ncbi:MAG: PDZ domain-containing protein [Bacteroidales bacterium]|nr:PDZ domain-containing protein [Bacteroidales bacterium]